MNESFLHFIWQYQYFTRNDLTTTRGESIQIFHPGMFNSHAGPDFSNSRIKIGELEWRGSVEMHVRAGEWFQHRHDIDPAYGNVVLHVVWEEDKPVWRQDGSSIPTLELKGRIDEDVILKYRRLVANPSSIPCANVIESVSDLIKISTIDKALMTRLEWKADIISQLLKENQDDWEETTYQLLSRYLGFKTNSDAMELLAKSTPYKILLKHADQIPQVEALLFGISGLLEANGSADFYSTKLAREYDLLSHKYQLRRKQMNPAHWRFLRLRPANFPTIRIAQLASLIGTSKNIFSQILELASIEDAKGLFRITQSPYWCNHYHFGRQSSTLRAGMGNQSVDSLIINVVVPLLVCYGRTFGEQQFIDKAIGLLDKIAGERNTITNLWRDLGFEIESANDSQGLIELYNNYCQRRRCLFCEIGVSILKPQG